jgi:putative component of membrane protein insertase Oxa1/YidC/SpoIIIJ protein YidD
MLNWSAARVFAIVLVGILTACAGGGVGSHSWAAVSRDSLATRGTTANLKEAAVGPSLVLARSLLFVYQRGAAPGKGQACPMYPSCSEYARLAVLRRGVLKGIVMAADRLHRCGHDLRYYPKVAGAGNWLKAHDEP